jgi:hypothetical protein
VIDVGVCNDSEFPQKYGGFCYEKCPDGMKMSSAGVCSTTCPEGTTDLGLTCTRQSYSNVGFPPFYMKPKQRDAPFGEKDIDRDSGVCMNKI